MAETGGSPSHAQVLGGIDVLIETLTGLRQEFARRKGRLSDPAERVEDLQQQLAFVGGWICRVSDDAMRREAQAIEEEERAAGGSPERIQARVEARLEALDRDEGRIM